MAAQARWTRHQRAGRMRRCQRRCHWAPMLPFRPQLPRASLLLATPSRTKRSQRLTPRLGPRQQVPLHSRRKCSRHRCSSSLPMPHRWRQLPRPSLQLHPQCRNQPLRHIPLPNLRHQRMQRRKSCRTRRPPPQPRIRPQQLRCRQQPPRHRQQHISLRRQPISRGATLIRPPPHSYPTNSTG